MFVTRQIPAEHKDLIHDISYAFHGRRMATCSSDQTVKVFELFIYMVNFTPCRIIYYMQRTDMSPQALVSDVRKVENAGVKLGP